MKGEIVIVPTYQRNEFLFSCLRRIRKYGYDGPIAVFPDRGTYDDPVLWQILHRHNAYAAFVPKHDYHGNTYCAMEALRWAYNGGFQTIFYIEDDVMVHPDFFTWHRQQHEQWGDLFASMAWVFNRHAPLEDDVMFQPWYYAIGTCFRRKKLRKIVEHASPLYYADMPGYIERTFRDSKLNTPFAIEHYEQDGLIQRVLDADRSQTVSSGIAKCSHVGCFGYNRGWLLKEDLFSQCRNFQERVIHLEEFIRDPYWRAEIFGKDVVEREIGKVLEERSIHYKVELPGGWESEFRSSLRANALPKRINSVPMPPEAKFMILS